MKNPRDNLVKPFSVFAVGSFIGKEPFMGKVITNSFAPLCVTVVSVPNTLRS